MDAEERFRREPYGSENRAISRTKPPSTMRRTPFSKIENSLEFMVERPFSMLFRRSVQPAEVGKRLKRELTSGEMVSVRGRVAPNDFLVRLSPADAGPYLEHGRALGDDLAEWLEEVALASRLVTLGAIQVRFEPSESIRRGRFDVRASVSEPAAEPVLHVDPGLTEAFDVARRPDSVLEGYIEICSGPATGALFPVRKQLVTIGRDLSNDLVIDSPEVSRFHAELHSSGGRLAVGDRNSLNGTFVNGIAVAGLQAIESGDQIVFGTTICRFWRELL
jgi:hypothetical protein